jgi:hypothetical protein
MSLKGSKADEPREYPFVHCLHVKVPRIRAIFNRGWEATAGEQDIGREVADIPASVEGTERCQVLEGRSLGIHCPLPKEGVALTEDLCGIAERISDSHMVRRLTHLINPSFPGYTRQVEGNPCAISSRGYRGTCFLRGPGHAAQSTRYPLW